jgi:hypothetical protein
LGNGFCQNQPESARATPVSANPIKVSPMVQLNLVFMLEHVRFLMISNSTAGLQVIRNMAAASEPAVTGRIGVPL